MRNSLGNRIWDFAHTNCGRFLRAQNQKSVFFGFRAQNFLRDLKMGFCVMTILVIFWSIFGDRMANLGLIDFKIGLYIEVNVSVGKNKFEVHIYQFAQNAINCHKIGQMPLWRMDIKWP